MGLYYRGNDGTDSCVSGNTDTSKLEYMKSVKVGSTLITASGDNQVVEFAEGSNITITPDATNGKVTISSSASAVSSIPLTGDNSIASLFT